MKILVLVQDYPSESKRYAMSYVHTRCLGYLKGGHDVTVLNFSSKKNYQYEGVSVVSDKGVVINDYDLIASHAPNLKNHLRFLKAVKGRRVVFFFHGHEVLLTSQYPQPYFWKRNKWRSFKSAAYDRFKLLVLKYWFPYFSSRNKVGVVFVSEWMRERFESNLGLRAENIGRVQVIPNSVHDSFVSGHYDKNAQKSADFITIRPLDESKYCVDLVVKLAEENPFKSFHLYGRGDFFKYLKKPENLFVFDDFVPQSEIPAMLDRYRFALMPTRYDAQGVMMCEMATYGIPMITSGIDICQEMLKGYENVSFLPLSEFSLGEDLPISSPVERKNLRFLSKDLICKEVNFFDEL